MRTRILIGVGAWLIGAITATCGSLLAVSLLGNSFGVSPSQGQQLSVAAVNAALATAAPEHGAVPAGHGSSAPLAKVRHARRRQAGAPRSSAPRAAPAAPAPNAQAGTLLASPAGTVLASCASGGAYLVSWSPAQGYGTDQVVRGPGSVALVTFDAGAEALTMQVSCRSNAPVAATSWGHDDDGGSGGDGSGGGD